MKKIKQIDSKNIKILHTLERHYKNICRIEKNNFDPYWDEYDFHGRLYTMNTFCITAEHRGLAIGYSLYQKHDKKIEIERIAVQENFRRKSIAIQLLYKIFTQLTTTKHGSISIKVPEYCLAAQLFFKDAGFIATEILDKEYLMQYYT